VISHAKRLVVNRGEHHRDALAPGDLALVFVAVTREFVRRVELKTTFLDPMPSDLATSGPAVSMVLLGDVEDWTSGVPLDVAVKRIDPKGSNPTNAGLTDPSEARPREHSCFVRGR